MCRLNTEISDELCFETLCPFLGGGQTHSVVHHCLVSAGYLVSLSELLWMSSVVKCRFPAAILTGD